MKPTSRDRVQEMKKVLQARAPASKVSALSGVNCVAAGSPSNENQKKPAPTTNGKLIKKAYVRFDDYLDLNEENMRRSCKRLMNHLYSESNPTQVAAEASLAVSCQSQALDERHPTEALINFEAAPGENGKSLASQQQQQHQMATSGKSYLRSQYERRQQRQLQFAGKMQNQQQVDAGARRRLQQDLVVARSHELSKRRFFEELERRESMKNSNQSTQPGGAKHLAPAAGLSSKCSPPEMSKRDESESESEQRIAGNEELMLKVYQSIVLKESSDCKSVNSAPSKQCDNKQAQPAGTDGTLISGEVAAQSELIEFQNQEGSLIEFSRGKLQNDGSQTRSGVCVAVSEDEAAAFEIRVPSSNEEFISFTERLFVKQVDLKAAPEPMEHSSPPTLSGCQRGDTNLQDNKKEPLIELNSGGGGDGGLECSSEEAITMEKSCAESISSDNHQIKNQEASAGFSSAISSGSETISSARDEEQTTGRLSGSKETQAKGTERLTIEVCGETNCAKSHAAPETGEQIKQSGGGGAADLNGAVKEAVNLSESLKVESSAHPAAEQTCAAAAQTKAAQQVEEATTTTTTRAITNFAIRDVLPEANEINRPTAAQLILVSSSSSSQANEDEKVGGSESGSKQRSTNEEEPQQPVPQVVEQSGAQHEGFTRDYYANALEENNVSRLMGLMGKKGELQLELEGGDEENIDLRQAAKLPLELASFAMRRRDQANQFRGGSKQQSTSGEEDGGSSCGSSGFGASLSVGSSDGCSPSALLSENLIMSSLAQATPKQFEQESTAKARGTNSLVMNNNNALQARYSLTSTLCGTSASYSALFHSGASSRAGKQQANKSCAEQEYPDYKQLVGPDQAYPSKARPASASASAAAAQQMLIENHNYASVSFPMANESSLHRTGAEKRASGNLFEEQQQLNDEGSQRSIVLERDDDHSTVGYANLPTQRRFLGPPVNSKATASTTLVEYASVRPQQEKMATIGKNNNNNNSSASIASLSGQSYSTTSGGFSAMTPAQISSTPAKNSNSLPDEDADENLNAPLQQSKSNSSGSLLKRFGSLVSRAFSTTTATSKLVQAKSINDHANDDDKSSHRLHHSNANKEPKAALVIEQENHQVAARGFNKSLSEVDEADLVILPTKHSNINQANLSQQRKQLEQANQRRLDDRLSRGRQSRKLLRGSKKKRRQCLSRSASSSSSNPSANGFCSTLDCSSSGNFSYSRSEHEKVRRADSLSEELESLMSKSSSSVFYQGDKRIERQKAASSKRIDIDCSRSTVQASGKFAHQRPASRAHGSSLLRIFSQQQHSSSLSSSAELTPGKLINATACNNHKLRSKANGSAHQMEQPISGFWGFSSLMSPNHAVCEEKLSKREKKKLSLRLKESSKEVARNTSASLYGETDEYNRLNREQPLQQRSGATQVDSLEEKYRSLSLCQNLLRSYTKRRQRKRGHHHHHHHHHHHRHQRMHKSDRLASFRHTQLASRCGEDGARPSSSYCSSQSAPDSQLAAPVWGQLIKINKLDGSQVIELQRSIGKSWGFFVARGAINNTKGIFISRMHDHSLAGLLSIGDRILAIDECPIEQDYDILQVNQMISKKSKILLKVKPFKS